MWVEHARRPDHAAWGLIAIMATVCLLTAAGLAFRLDAATAIIPAGGVALLCAGSLAGRLRDQPRLAMGATAFLQMTVFTLIGVLLSYALAARAGPLWDGRFAAVDRAMGFDWPAIVRAADGSPRLLWIGGLAYHSLTLQMIVCIVVLSAAGCAERLRRTVVAAILSGFVTILISGVTPAMGNVFDPAGYRHLWPSVAWTEQAMLAGLRDGSWRTIDLTRLMGIVTFPSYHATLPIILAWALRDRPWWRAIAPAWAAVTIVATPLFGGHYAIDVLAGAGLAVLGLAVTPWLLAPRGEEAAPPHAAAGGQAKAAWIDAAAAGAPPAVAISAASRDAASR